MVVNCRIVAFLRSDSLQRVQAKAATGLVV